MKGSDDGLTFCGDCGLPVKAYMAFERRDKIYCAECVGNTAEKRAYERWFVDPQS